MEIGLSTASIMTNGITCLNPCLEPVGTQRNCRRVLDYTWWYTLYRVPRDPHVMQGESGVSSIWGVLHPRGWQVNVVDCILLRTVLTWSVANIYVVVYPQVLSPLWQKNRTWLGQLQATVCLSKERLIVGCECVGVNVGALTVPTHSRWW